MKIIKSIVLLMVLSATCYGQDGYTGVSWNVSIPASKTKDFVGASLRGVGLEIRKFVRDQVSVGGSFAWHVLTRETVDQISVNSGGFGADITGKQFRYVNSFPFLLTVHGYLNRGEGFFPFAGLGAGAYHIRNRLEVGTTAIDQNNWHFGLAPEVGFGFQLGGAQTLISLRYNYAAAAGRSIGGEKTSHQYFNLNIGFAFSHDYY